MTAEIRRAILFTAVMIPLVFAYHLALWGFGRAAFPAKAEGSLIRRSDGTVLGSRLLAQAFTRDDYFHPRPSAVECNAASTGGSNYAPSNPDHLKAVKERLDKITRLEGVAPGQVLSDMVTASGSGMDPDIPPESAYQQAARVARARGVSEDRLRELIRMHIQPPTFGFLGRARVNVLELNLALDQSPGAPQAPTQ